MTKSVVKEGGMWQDFCGSCMVSTSLDAIKEVLPHERDYLRNLQFTSYKAWIGAGEVLGNGRGNTFQVKGQSPGFLPPLRFSY